MPFLTFVTQSNIIEGIVGASNIQFIILNTICSLC